MYIYMYIIISKWTPGKDSIALKKSCVLSATKVRHFFMEDPSWENPSPNWEEHIEATNKSRNSPAKFAKEGASLQDPSRV